MSLVNALIFFVKSREYWYAKRMFRRVIGPLVAVFVIAQSFWLLMPPSTNAADDPIVTACAAANDGGVIKDANHHFTFSAESESYDIGFRFDTASSLRLAFTATLYTKPGGKTTFEQLSMMAVNKFEGVNASNEPTDKWSANKIIDARVTGKDFILIVESPRGSSKVSICFKTNDNSTGGGGYTLSNVKSWFRTGESNSDIKDLKITYNNEKSGNPPKIIIPKTKLNGAPEDITFKLVGVFAPGDDFTQNVDWVIYQGYVGVTKLENLYFLHDDGVSKFIAGQGSGFTTNFYWTTDFNALKAGQVDDEDVIEIQRANHSGSLEDNLNEFYGYITNVPLAVDDESKLDPDNNCGEGRFVATDQKVKLVGPKNKNMVPEPDLEKVTEFSGTVNDTARNLNSNCINTPKNHTSWTNGWLKYWGITDITVISPGEEGPCGIGEIFRETKGDIGKLFSKMTECLFQSIFEPMIRWATELVIKAAGITYYRQEIGDRWRLA